MPRASRRRNVTKNPISPTRLNGRSIRQLVKFANRGGELGKPTRLSNKRYGRTELGS